MEPAGERRSTPGGRDDPVAAGDADALADMTGLATDLDEAISQTISGLRKARYSWAKIAVRLGVTRQAAQQRWGHRQ